MPYLQLLPHISFAIADDRAVFLDLRRDRYFAFDRAAATAFETLRSSPNDSLGDAPAATLLATGMFASARTPSEFLPARIPIPERTLGGGAANPRFEDLVQVLFLLARSRRAIRGGPLEKVIARRRGRAAERSGARSPDAILALARRFQRARAMIPIKPTCLQDSLALHDWLATRGATASLVLGVRLHPFAAHCWVQLGDTVLNDAADRVSAYTPILVV